jgi:hypothetical protein
VWKHKINKDDRKCLNFLSCTPHEGGTTARKEKLNRNIIIQKKEGMEE